MNPPCCALCCYISMKNPKERINLCEEEEKGGKSSWETELQITLRLWGYTYVELSLCTWYFSICSREMLLTEVEPFQNPWAIS